MVRKYIPEGKWERSSWWVLPSISARSPNLGATNSSGFTALPGGLRNYDGTFEGLTYSGTCWTNAMGDTLESWEGDLYYDTANVGRYDNGYVNWGCSVRCVKD